MAETTRIAVVQSRIEQNIATNGAHIRGLLDSAVTEGATLALFPEGALSGYCKTQVTDWAKLDWATLAEETAAIAAHADQLGITALIGTAHPVPAKRPHNSLRVLPGTLRYDKRYLSNTEVLGWYMPGSEPMVLHHGGLSFGTTICIESNFPELYAEYEALGVDCILHATYGLGDMGDVMLRAHAATNCLWLAVATPANRAEPASGIMGPDGHWLARCGSGIDIAVAELDRADPKLDIALNKARPWRRLARQGDIYRNTG